MVLLTVSEFSHGRKYGNMQAGMVLGKGLRVLYCDPQAVEEISLISNKRKKEAGKFEGELSERI